MARAEDRTPPQISSFSISPSEVNTEAADRTVTVTLTLTDDQAGVASQGDSGQLFGCEMYLHPLIGTQGAHCTFTRTSGTDLNGTYVGTVTFPRGSKEGVWNVSGLTLTDKLGNSVGLDWAALEQRFGAGCASVTNTAAHGDGTPPQISSFSISPSEVNTEAADRTVTVTLTLTDDQAGVASQGDSGQLFGCEMYLHPLIGTQGAHCTFTRTSGTDLNGTYVGTVTFPRGSKEGVWNVSGLTLTDKLGNSVGLDSDALTALLPQAEGVLVANTATAQQVTIEREWTISTTRTSVAFPAGTVVTRADTGRFAFYQMLAQEFALDDSIPSTDFDGTPLATLKLGIPGLNLSFSQPVEISMEVGAAYNGYRLSIQSLTEGGEAWVNETTCTVVSGRIQFTVNHATKFVANLTKSSVPKPSVTRLTPTKARRGAIVTITGKNFGMKRGRSVVKFGTRACGKYVSWSSTRIKCRVPAKAKFGRLQVKVTTSAGTSNGRTFTVKR